MTLQKEMTNNYQKYYTRIIGIAFTLVIISLITDLATTGYTPETWHKIFHVLLGVVILKIGWNNEKFWKPFCLVNGAFFTFTAAFGLAFPDFAGLAAFNTIDTILHATVGITGLTIGRLRGQRKS